MKKTMKKSDWITLRLLRKMAKSPEASKWLNDNEVVRTVVFLEGKYGKKYFHECIQALADEEQQKREAYLRAEEERQKKQLEHLNNTFAPPRSLNKAMEYKSFVKQMRRQACQHTKG